MDKPDVDSIEGLSPAISIDQKTTSRNPRSTVGTVTEIYDYLRLLWARIGKPHCFNCGRPIAAQSAEQIIDQIMGMEEGTRFMVLAPIVRGRKGEYGKQLEELRSEGFTRVKVDGELRQLEEEIVLDKKYKHDISVVVDRLVDAAGPAQAAGRLGGDRGRAGRRDHRGRDRAARRREPEVITLLRALRLPALRDLDARAGAALVLVQLAARRLPALHRAGLADGDRPGARGAGPVAVDQRGRDPAVVVGRDRATTSRSRRRSPSATRSTWTRRGRTCPRSMQDLFLYGTNGDKLYVSYRNRMGRKRSYMTTFEGIVPNLERRYKETDSDWSREKIEEYMSMRPCPECKGARLRPESRAVKVGGMPIHEFTRAERASARSSGWSSWSSPTRTGRSRG